MRKLIDLIFRQPDQTQDWTIVRMRAATQQIGPRYQSGLFTQHTEVPSE